MDLKETLRLFIDQYFEQKINHMNLNHEKAISESENDRNHEILNKTLADLTKQIQSTKQDVLNRFDTIKLKYGDGICKKNQKDIKDEIFVDKYCYVLDIFENRKFKIPVITELRIGILIFSQYEDDFLEHLKY